MSYVGKAVYCTTCELRKKPIGRDSRDNGLCDQECPGYREEPYPDTLWPGEESEPCPMPQNCGQSSCDCERLDKADRVCPKCLGDGKRWTPANEPDEPCEWCEGTGRESSSPERNSAPKEGT